MSPGLLIGLACVLLVSLVLVTRRGMRSGATRDERSMSMAGDAWLEGGPRLRVRMTRAIAIHAGPDSVWPWIEQMGRGAGWYSIDRLDNGGRTSARHLVSWIPAAQLGDATGVGYLRHLTPGRGLAWWIPGDRLLGARIRTVMEYRVAPDGGGARVVSRMSWDAAGPTARIVVWVFAVIDSIMARRQLLNLKERLERFGARAADPEAPETGAPDQYQLYHVVYASGSEAGSAGKEGAAKWRRAAVADGVIPAQVNGT